MKKLFNQSSPFSELKISKWKTGIRGKLNNIEIKEKKNINLILTSFMPKDIIDKKMYLKYYQSPIRKNIEIFKKIINIPNKESKSYRVKKIKKINTFNPFLKDIKYNLDYNQEEKKIINKVNFKPILNFGKKRNKTKYFLTELNYKSKQRNKNYQEINQRDAYNRNSTYNTFRKDGLKKLNFFSKFDELLKINDIEKNLNLTYAKFNTERTKSDKIKTNLKEKFKMIDRYAKKETINEQIIQDIRKDYLKMDFNEFYEYLLSMLKNYDKKISKGTFEIKIPKKECPEELKYKNVKIRHRKFLNILTRQYIAGINFNKNYERTIKKSKELINIENEQILQNNSIEPKEPILDENSKILPEIYKRMKVIVNTQD